MRVSWRRETGQPASPVRVRAFFLDSNASLGEDHEALAKSEEADVTVQITACADDGSVLGTATTEATARYGDILIDGVPLQFD